MLDIELLRIIWWVLLGVLFTGFAVMDGFDLGTAILFPLITRDETERRIVLNTIEPVWEGNQVWLVLGAGAIFAAWPYVYAVVFSGFYYPCLLLLLTLGIARPVSFKYRSKLSNRLWRRTWDWVVFVGGLCPALLFGILIANLLAGIPFYFDNDLRIVYSGSLLDLFHPFAAICALTSVAMLVMHGGLYLAIKTEDPIRQRAIAWSRLATIVCIILFAIGGWWVANQLIGFQVASVIDHNGYSNPLYKQVLPKIGAWIANYSVYPWTKLAPALGFMGAFAAFVTAGWGNSKVAFVCSSMSIIGIIGTVGVSMFPFILPSSTSLSSGLLVWDASSSRLTLLLMLGATIIFLPIILAYISWVYYILRGKVLGSTVENDNTHKAY
jgi:cytochrome d ubiquinol oxidase subunit II